MLISWSCQPTMRHHLGCRIQTKSCRTAHRVQTSYQPCAKPPPASKEVLPRPRVAEPRPGYGPFQWSQQWWEGQWWGSSQDVCNSWGWQAGWHQQW